MVPYGRGAHRQLFGDPPAFGGARSRIPTYFCEYADRSHRGARFAPPAVTRPYRRRFGWSADCQAPVQNRTVFLERSDCCLLISAEAMLRARPAAAFALLNHMLIS